MARGQRKKKLMAIQREKNAAKREAEREANTARKFKPSKTFVEYVPKESKYVITDAMKRVANAPSVATTAPRHVKYQKVELTPEMAERERIAREELERKKKRMAPLYNKGGYQYVDPDAPSEIVKNLGRKV